jgi:hypothetical protein
MSTIAADGYPPGRPDGDMREDVAVCTTGQGLSRGRLKETGKRHEDMQRRIVSSPHITNRACILGHSTATTTAENPAAIRPEGRRASMAVAAVGPTAEVAGTPVGVITDEKLS